MNLLLFHHIWQQKHCNITRRNGFRDGCQQAVTVYWSVLICLMIRALQLSSHARFRLKTESRGYVLLRGLKESSMLCIDKEFAPCWSRHCVVWIMRHAVCFVATNETANGKSKKHACFKGKVRVIDTCQYCKTVLRLRTIQFRMLLATPGLKEDENACIMLSQHYHMLYFS